MLNIIVGVARSGKTTLIKERIKATVSTGRRALLIVPEQASFYNERTLQDMLGKCSHKAEVFSFSRLSELLLRQLGGRDRQPVTATAQVFLMSMALDELSDVLTVYGRHYRSRGFIEQTLAVVEECRNAGIMPEQLSAFSLALPEGSLRDKVHELSLIYDAFEAILHRSYLSSHDMIEMASQRLQTSELLNDADVFVDDFGGFTAPEFSLISAILSQAHQLTVAICCDEIRSKQPAFALAADTINRLINIAEDARVEIKYTVLPEPVHLVTALLEMERATRCESLPNKEKQHSEGVQALACANPYEELETVASEIAQLVHEKGFRYREVAVIARDMSRYISALPSVFARYELPYFWDMRRDARSSALTQGVLEAVMVACSTREADWLSVARSPLFGLDAELIGELENYCFVWSVRQSMWEHPFCNNPDGMVEIMSEKASNKLAQLEEARRKITEPVLSLRKAIKSGQGSRIAKGLWQFLQEIEAKQHLAQFADVMHPEEKSAFLEEQSLLWQQLIGLIELFDAVSDELSISVDRVSELIELSFGGFEVATVPRTLDEVAVGTADRIRCENVRAVFLLGAIEGEFPSSSMPGGLLSEPERRQLSQGGLSLLTEGDRSQATERMFCYRAVTSPSEHLVVCCPRTDAAGAALLPSSIFMRAAALTVQTSQPDLKHIWTLAGLEKTIAEQSEAQGSELAILSELGRESLGDKRVQRLLRANEKREHKIENKSISQELFGNRIKLSPSRLEQYYKCPFSYYMQKGLGARTRQKAELSPLQAGTLIHRVLEKMVSRHGGKGLADVPANQLRQEINDEIVSYLTECVGDLSNIPARLLSNFERLGGWLFDMVSHLAQELAQSEFEPIAFELQIGENKQVEPLSLKTDAGAEVIVEGTVDRIDIATVNGKKYVRVLDYKSGKKSFLLEDVYYGLNLQMLIYLFSINQNGTGELGDTIPAGALYVPAQGSYISSTRDADIYQLQKKRQKQYEMNGLLLSDEDVLRAMERDLSGAYIPYVEGKKADALYSLAELGKLQRMVEDRIQLMAQQLYDGEIQAVPSCRDNESPCDYCDYRTACGFEQGDTVRSILKLDREKIFKEGWCEDGEQTKVD